MENDWIRSAVGGFPSLLWETPEHLGYTEPPTYFYCETDVEGVPKCEMHLHIIEHPPDEEFRVRCVEAQGIELWDTCQIAARRALLHYCQEHEISIEDTHAKYYPAKDQTTDVWCKKVQEMEKAEPQDPAYTLISTAKYLHTLDALHYHQEKVMEEVNMKRKQAEDQAQDFKMELLMLSTQLKAMKKEKEQCQKELQEALARPKTRKKRRRTN
jgi:hypothetical protein